MRPKNCLWSPSGRVPWPMLWHAPWAKSMVPKTNSQGSQSHLVGELECEALVEAFLFGRQRGRAVRILRFPAIGGLRFPWVFQG